MASPGCSCPPACRYPLKRWSCPGTEVESRPGGYRRASALLHPRRSASGCLHPRLLRPRLCRSLPKGWRHPTSLSSESWLTHGRAPPTPDEEDREMHTSCPFPPSSATHMRRGRGEEHASPPVRIVPPFCRYFHMFTGCFLFQKKKSTTMRSDPRRWQAEKLCCETCKRAKPESNKGRTFSRYLYYCSDHMARKRHHGE